MAGNPKHFQQERREFIRVRHKCPVEYSFVGAAESIDSATVYQGVTDNISGGGLKLVGTFPNPDWVPLLLLGKVALAVSIQLPGEGCPVKGMTRTAWIEGADPKTHKFLLGLRFREIAPADRERIVQFIIKKQLK